MFVPARPPEFLFNVVQWPSSCVPHEVVILILAGPWLISTIFWIYVKLRFSIYPVIGFISHIVHRNLGSSSWDLRDVPFRDLLGDWSVQSFYTVGQRTSCSSCWISGWIHVVSQFFRLQLEFIAQWPRLYIIRVIPVREHTAHADHLQRCGSRWSHSHAKGWHLLCRLHNNFFYIKAFLIDRSMVDLVLHWCVSSSAISRLPFGMCSFVIFISMVERCWPESFSPLSIRTLRCPHDPFGWQSYSTPRKYRHFSAQRLRVPCSWPFSPLTTRILHPPTERLRGCSDDQVLDQWLVPILFMGRSIRGMIGECHRWLPRPCFSLSHHGWHAWCSVCWVYSILTRRFSLMPSSCGPWYCWWSSQTPRNRLDRLRRSPEISHLSVAATVWEMDRVLLHMCWFVSILSAYSSTVFATADGENNFSERTFRASPRPKVSIAQTSRWRQVRAFMDKQGLKRLSPLRMATLAWDSRCRSGGRVNVRLHGHGAPGVHSHFLSPAGRVLELLRGWWLFGFVNYTAIDTWSFVRAPGRLGGRGVWPWRRHLRFRPRSAWAFFQRHFRCHFFPVQCARSMELLATTVGGLPRGSPSQRHKAGTWTALTSVCRGAF